MELIPLLAWFFAKSRISQLALQYIYISRERKKIYRSDRNKFNLIRQEEKYFE